MRSVLVVDDDVAILQSLVRNLARMRGRTVHGARDPDTALEIAIRERPDIAIVDGSLGPTHRSGYQLVAELKEKLPELRAWMMSGSASEAYREYARTCGAEDLLEKPFTFAEFTRAIFGRAEYSDDDSLQALKARYIGKVLSACGGNKSEGARSLGVTRTSFQRMLKDIEP